MLTTLLQGSAEMLERLTAHSPLAQHAKDALAALGYKPIASWLSLGRAPSLDQASSGDVNSNNSWSSIGAHALSIPHLVPNSACTNPLTRAYLYPFTACHLLPKKRPLV